jgi:chromosome segregation ATPase
MSTSELGDALDAAESENDALRERLRAALLENEGLNARLKDRAAAAGSNYELEVELDKLREQVKDLKAEREKLEAEMAQRSADSKLEIQERANESYDYRRERDDLRTRVYELEQKHVRGRDVILALIEMIDWEEDGK